MSFVSKGCRGRVSDKHLTVSCGFLEYLLSGDTILADRGSISKRVLASIYCATVKLPAFTIGKKQLSGIEVEETKHITNVSPLIHNPKENVDKIVTIPCSLNNLCNSIVPPD